MTPDQVDLAFTWMLRAYCLFVSILAVACIIYERSHPED